MDDATRDAVIDALMNPSPELRGNLPGLIDDVGRRFPEVSEDEIFLCLDEAANKLEQRVTTYVAEAYTLRRLHSLFEGMPEGMSLGECAVIKAAQGDSLAIAYLEWEAEQSGGVQ